MNVFHRRTRPFPLFYRAKVKKSYRWRIDRVRSWRCGRSESRIFHPWNLIKWQRIKPQHKWYTKFWGKLERSGSWDIKCEKCGIHIGFTDDDGLVDGKTCQQIVDEKIMHKALR